MKLFKRSLAMLVALVMCVGMLSLNAFATELNTCPKCGSLLGHMDGYAAKCTTPGSTGGYYCTNVSGCGWSGVEEIPATNHAGKYVIPGGETATCSKAGTVKYYCPDCKGMFTETTTTNPGNHVNLIGTATCTSKQICMDCGQSVGELNLNAHNKSSSSWTSKDGKHVESWACGHEKQSHEIGDCPNNCPLKDTQTTEPTECQHPNKRYQAGAMESNGNGNHTWFCDDCGKNGLEKHDAKLTFTEPNCTEDGERTWSCACGASATSKNGYAKGHSGNFSYQATGAQKESTCTVKGFETHLRRCTVCGTTETKTVDRDLLDHDWDDGVETKKPTCQEEGETTFTCAVGGETRKESIDKLTHGVDENKDGKCDNCGEPLDNTGDQCTCDPKPGEGEGHQHGCPLHECDENCPQHECEHGKAPGECDVDGCENNPNTGDNNQGGNNTGNGNQGGNNNQGGTTGGTTGGVTDPDPVDSGDDLTIIEEEEVPLAGLPFDLDATDELTRGLFAYIIYWFEGEPDAETSSFTDVAEDYEYAQAIAWGDANGILLGYGDGTFRPDNGITREEMVLILNRYANYKKAELVVEMDGDPYDVMLWVEAEEIVNDFLDRLSGEELPEGQEAA